MTQTLFYNHQPTYIMFQANDKVICINGDFRDSVFGIPGSRFLTPDGVPREGKVYCVRKVVPGENGTQGLFLAGIRTFLDGREAGFNSTRFRKAESPDQAKPSERGGAGSDPKPHPAPQVGDWVVCEKDFAVYWLRNCFELCPAKGEALRVSEVGLPVPRPAGGGDAGLRLRGIVAPDGNRAEFGLPASHFRVLPEAEAKPGWHAFLRRLDRHRLSQFHKLVNSGADFGDLPFLLQQWWMNRY